MGSTYYGKNGAMRIYDSTKGRDLSQAAPIEVRILTEIAAVFSNITANQLDPLAGSDAILSASTNYVYIGNLFKFSRVTIDLASLASADGGLLVAEYWNGSAWVAVTGLVDGTAVAGNTMRQDGSVSFNVPTNWATNDPPTAGTVLYYIRIRTTASTGTDAVAQLIEPSSGQYYEVVFHQMNLQGPEGRNRPEEIARLNRGQLDGNTHYIQGLDDPTLEPIPVTFGALLDSVHNKVKLAEALACGNPNIPDTWPKVGISTKTDSEIPSGLTGVMVRTPPFTDPTKKTTTWQAMWDDLTGSRIFRVYNEVYAPSGNVTLQEAPDSVTLTVQGGIFGSVRTDLTAFGYDL